MFLKVAIVVLCFALGLQATAAAPKHFALSDYILSSDEILKLNSDEQEIYFNFLIYLTGVVETAGGQKTIKQASLDFDLRRLIREAFDNEAHAVPLLLAAPVLIGASRALIVAAPRALPVMARYWATFRSTAVTTMSARGGQASLLITEEAAKKAALQKAVIWSTVAAGATDITHRLAGGGQAEALAPQQPSGVQDIPAQATKSVAAANSYVKPDSICVFGGRASIYKQMADGSILCTRPKDNSGGKCLGTEEAPKYQCENFGLLQAPDTEAVAKSLCIPLFSENGLTDLSARCVGVASAWLKANPPTKMDPAQWSAFADKMKKYLAEYEGQRKANAVTLAQYCEGGNKINAAKQQPECVAILGLLGELKKYTKVESLIVARQTQAPAGASSAPASGSSAPGAQ